MLNVLCEVFVDAEVKLMRSIATDVARSVICLSVCWAHG